MLDAAAMIFAGGQGTRLWPLSRDRKPKQFQPVTGDDPLLSLTIDRLKERIPVERIYVSTLSRYRDSALDCRAGVPEENFIFEDEGKGPAAAYILAMSFVQGREGDVPVFSCPSDHIVDDDRAFIEAMSTMITEAQEHPDVPVLMCARPTRPDVGLGYFTAQSDTDDDPGMAVSMVEKPPRDHAKELIASGNAYWNLASYAVYPDIVIGAYRRARPFLTAAVTRHVRADTDTAYRGPSNSGHELDPLFECGIRSRLVVGGFGWNDVGTWPRLEALLSAQGVNSIGNSVTAGAENVLAISLDGRPIVALGASELIIVSHEDAVYILDRTMASERSSLDRLRSLLAEAPREDLL